ncbi:BRO family protein [Pseudorhodoferax sp. Leaf274]|uniref:BRO-N domain-containing protein n=1 Tax=Pseudorhodoferax sp. Leaf274 TaxID=1736318 RepID=UPI0007024E3E|nr:BRO family protein [Pseudorhodoferax sp. Leaf274]KQP43943.1 hypothetical protein ASF44_28870 [Pseudorhodoferax sp. Leaf274]
MSNIVPFNFDGHRVTVISDESGEPLFVAKEVASILGYSDAEAMTRRLDEDEKQNRQIVGFGPRGVTVINESGLYSAILASQKTEAGPFKKWVTKEVLPSIRKTGSYTAKNAVGPLKATAEAAKAFPALARVARMLGCDKNAAAIAANQAIFGLTNINLMKQLGTTHLEAEKQDTLWFTPTELGQRFHNTSARGMNLLLAEAGLQAKINDKWEPTQVGREFCRLFDTSKKHGSGVPVMQVKWSINVLPMLGESKEAA